MQKKIGTPYKESVFEAFVAWYALPPMDKEKTGMKTQGDFCKRHKIHKDTITRWKQREEFRPKVDQLHKEWGFDKKPNILFAIYKSAIQGNAKSQKLWLQYVEGFNPYKKRKDIEKSIILTPEDIFHLIEVLPKEKQNKYNDMMKELLADASVAQAKDFQNDDKDKWENIPEDFQPRFVVIDLLEPGFEEKIRELIEPSY